MADENVTQRDEITSALHYAGQLSMIMQWIENARLVLDAVELAKNNDRELTARCDKHSIPFGNADWDVDQSDALSFLCIMQRNYLTRATEINEEMEVAHV